MLATTAATARARQIDFSLSVSWEDPKSIAPNSSSLMPRITFTPEGIVMSVTPGAEPRAYKVTPECQNVKTWQAEERCTEAKGIYFPKGPPIGVILHKEKEEWKCSSMRDYGGATFRICGSLAITTPFSYRFIYEVGTEELGVVIKARFAGHVESDNSSCRLIVDDASRNYRSQPDQMVRYTRILRHNCSFD